jgi:hypothetical protein
VKLLRRPTSPTLAMNSCLPLVPSALAVNENNWLIHPQHPEFKKIVQHTPEPLRYDARMFRRGRPQKHRSRTLGPGPSISSVSPTFAVGAVQRVAQAV